MNVLIHRYNSICEPDFIEAFKAMGLTVIEDTAEMTRKNISSKERIETLAEAILTNQPVFVFTINFFPYISQICEKLHVLYFCVTVDCPVTELYSKQIRNSCNRVFLFDQKQYLDICNENPGHIFRIPLGAAVERINQTIGAPDFSIIDGKTSIPYKYDVSFVGSLYTEKNPLTKLMPYLSEECRGYLDGLLAAQGLLPGQTLLEEGITDKQIREIAKTNRADRNAKQKQASAAGLLPEGLLEDCIFPGNFMEKYTVVNQYLSPVLSAEDRIATLALLGQVLEAEGKKGALHLFTRSTEGIPDGVTLHGGVSTLTEMPKVFRTSRINLNMTIRSIQQGLPQRIWDVLGCGGFLLTNAQAELPDYFEIGTHLEIYENEQDLAEKVLYYLTHEEERMQIAKNGYELVKSRYSVLQTAMTMLKLGLQE